MKYIDKNYVLATPARSSNWRPNNQKAIHLILAANLSDQPGPTLCSNNQDHSFLRKGINKMSPKILSEFVQTEFARFEKVNEDKGCTGYVPTGLYDLDKIIDGGIHPGEIYLVGELPFMGMISNFLFNLAVRFSKESSRTVCILSMRHDEQTIARNILASESRITAHKMVRIDFEPRDWEYLVRATGLLSDLPLYIDASPGYTDEQFLSIIKNIKEDHGLGLIVLDGLEFMVSTEKYPSRKAEVNALVQIIREIARENHVPVIVSVTMSQKSDMRPSDRPILSDFGEWEPLATYAANTVLFLYRPEAHLIYTPATDKGVVEAIVAKNDRGETGMAKLAYLDCCRFENLALGYEELIPFEDS